MKSCVKSLLTLAAATLFGTTALAGLYITDSGGKTQTREANVTVKVGETASVYLKNSKNDTYATPGASDTTNATTQAKFSVVIPTNVNQTPKAMVITGIAATESPIAFKVWKNTSEGDTPVTITVTVVDKEKETDFNGCTVTTLGADVKKMGNGDLLLTFKSSGTLALDKTVDSCNLLVVGGGAAGNPARTGDQLYGASGQGGQAAATATPVSMAAGSYTITVGGGSPLSYKYESGWVQKSTGGGASSIAGNNGFATVSAAGGANAEGWGRNGGTAGSGGANLTSDITGASVVYGADGVAATSSSNGTAGGANTGAGGVGGYNSGAGGAGGSGIVVIRLLVPREEIPWPTVATGLVYDGTVQTGVSAEGLCHFSGTWAATDAGSYTATVTPSSGCCWPDKTYGEMTLNWSIARRAVTVSVVATNKVVGAEEPIYPTTAVGFVDGDGAEVSWKVWRTNLVEQADGSLGPDESLGTYDLVIAGSASETTNYEITYVNGVGAFEIRQAGPVIVDPDDPATDPTIRPKEGADGVYVVETKTEATTNVVISGLQPTDKVIVPEQIDTIVGVASDQVVIVGDATNGTETVKVDITDAFTITQNGTGVTITLNEDPAAEVTVEIGGVKETIKVKPELTDEGDAVVEPLTVETTEVDIGAKTIPGLTYDLNRSTELGGAAETVASETAKGTRTKLTDPMEGGKPPQAFYVIEVRK